MLNEIIKNGEIVQGEAYVHTLNEYGWTWEKLVLAIFTYVLSFAAVSAVLIIGTGIFLSTLGCGQSYWELIPSGDFDKLAYGEKVYDLILFAIFPAGILANRSTFKSKGWELISVEKRTRWKWTLMCTAVLLPIMVTGMVIQEIINKPFDIEFSSKAAAAIGLTFIFTPQQAPLVRLRRKMR